jgi:ABC-type phosphate transport system substrate-binding protein
VGAFSINIGYSLPNITSLVLDLHILAGIYAGTISTWDDPAIQQYALPAHPYFHPAPMQA